MLSAIVISRDRPEYVARCLAALVGQTAKLGKDFEIVVVEQGEASKELASGMPVMYVGLPYGEVVNRAWLCNVGARASSGEWLYQIDCDMILEREAVRKAIDWASGAAPRFYAMTRLRDLSEEETRAAQANYRRELDSGCGAPHEHGGGAGNPILFPAKFFAELGGYDEAFRGHGCQDLDMIERVRVAGGEVTAMPVRAWHQWHGHTPKRTAVLPNWRRYRKMRRQMRRNPALAVRNGGQWGLCDTDGGSLNPVL